MPGPNQIDLKLPGVCTVATAGLPCTKGIQSECRNLRGVLDAMADGVYIANQQGDIEYANPAIQADFGSVNGRKCHAYLSDRSETCPWCHRGEVLAGKMIQSEWHSPKTGKAYDVFDTPFPNPDGSVSKLAIFHDITARKQAEIAARESEDRYRLIANNVTDLIWTLTFPHPSTRRHRLPTATTTVLPICSRKAASRTSVPRLKGFSAIRRRKRCTCGPRTS